MHPVVAESALEFVATAPSSARSGPNGRALFIVDGSLIRGGLADEDRADLEDGVTPVDLVMGTAKVFWTGRFQVVRLPKEFRLAGEEVRIRRHGAVIILEPLPRDWAWLDTLSGKFDPDARDGALEEPANQDPPRSLSALLATLSSIEDEFPEITDPRP